jgi:hypothetical protein
LGLVGLVVTFCSKEAAEALMAFAHALWRISIIQIIPLSIVVKLSLTGRNLIRTLGGDGCKHVEQIYQKSKTGQLQTIDLCWRHEIICDVVPNPHTPANWIFSNVQNSQTEKSAFPIFHAATRMSDKQDSGGRPHSEQQQADYGAYQQCTLTLETENF